MTIQDVILILHQPATAIAIIMLAIVIAVRIITRSCERQQKRDLEARRGK